MIFFDLTTDTQTHVYTSPLVIFFVNLGNILSIMAVIVCRYRMMLFSSHNPEQSNSAMLILKLFRNDFCLCLKTLT